MEKHLRHQLELLQTEHKAEEEENYTHRTKCSHKVLENEGVLIKKLTCKGVKAGLFGRLLVKLAKPFGKLPTNKFGAGDVVGIFSSDITDPEDEGIVYKISSDHIIIACDSFSLQEVSCSIVMLANEVTFQKQRKAIENVLALKTESHAYNLSQVLLGESAPRIKQPDNIVQIINQDLNQIQQNAVQFVMNECLDVGIIHGPPGTGKTTTVIEVILQAVSKGLKVLATASSNIAVDNLVEKLDGKTSICRIGHPARMIPHISKYSLDNLLKLSDQASLNDDINREIMQINRQLQGLKGIAARELKRHLRSLEKEKKMRSNKGIDEVFSKSNVILTTNISAGHKFLQKFAEKIKGFDLVIIDEAAQALEASCWIPILLGKKLIMAGDHNQLPPTIKSEKAVKGGLDVTLMARICRINSETTRMLELQYRMHRLIMTWSSQEFYNGRLQADPSVAEHRLANYEPGPLVFVDTNGAGFNDAGSASKYNLKEVDIVRDLVQELLEAGEKDIAVITPYNAQVELLKNYIQNVEISTVDGFQGREKDVVIMSLVRSNNKKDVGFLKDFRRMNVAITRARKLVCLVGDSDTVGNSKSPEFLQRMCQYFNANAELRNPNLFNIGATNPIIVEDFEEEKMPKKKSDKKPKKNVKSQAQQFKEWHEAKIQSKNDLNQILEEVKSFKQNKNAEEYMARDLNGFERKQVHDLCEKLKLFHYSRGSGKIKSILIMKNEIPDDNHEFERFEDEELEESEENEEEKGEKQINTNKEEEKKEEDKVVDIKIITKEKPQKNKLIKAVPEGENIDEMEFLDQLINQNKYCNYKGCNKPIVNLMQTCKFCRGVFCFSHGVAEVHGCGDAAHQSAREGLKDTIPKPHYSSSSHLQKEELKRRLNDKITKLQEKQKPKNKKKKK